MKYKWTTLYINVYHEFDNVKHFTQSFINDKSTVSARNVAPPVNSDVVDTQIIVNDCSSPGGIEIRLQNQGPVVNIIIVCVCVCVCVCVYVCMGVQ